MVYAVQNLNDWYQAVQFRDADSATAKTWAAALNYALLTPEAVQQAIIDDAFTAAYVNPVIRLYQAAFDRIPDQAGQNFWVDDLAAGRVTTQDVANAFANSQEFKATYGTSNANSPISAAVLTALYQNVLQRDPDAAGYAYWLSSGLNVAQVLNYFANSPEFILSTDALIDLYQHSQLNHTLPAESVSLWYFLPPVPIPQPEPEPDPGPDPITFSVSNSGGSLSFGGTATGDVTFTVASDGTATFSRGGVVAASTFNVSAIFSAPETIKLSANAQDLSVASKTALVNIVNYDANGHTYSLRDSLATLLTVTPLTVSYQLSDSAVSLGALTVATANVVEAASNAADYSYTVADTIAHANALNFTTAYAHNVGVNLTGSTGSQTVTGSGYYDTISGGDGNDTIVGAAGADTISVGSDSDLLILNAVAGVGGSSDSYWGSIDVVSDLDANDVVQINATGVSAFNAVADVTQTGAYYRVVFNGLGYGGGHVIFANYGWNNLTDSYAQARTILNITGTSGSDSIVGGQNNDTITGGGGQDTLYGGGGNDSIAGGDLADSLVSGSGSDTIIGHDGVDILSGGAGDNYYVYTTNAEFVSSGAVVDSITGGADTDAIQINAAIILTTSDTLATRLVSVEELIAETQSTDTRAYSIVVNTSSKLGTVTTIDLSGDTNAASTGVITMIGVSTGLTLIGVNGGGSNTISGGAGNDSIAGGVGADTLRGGYGTDTIFGGDGNDSIVGNGDADVLTGGGGNDVFTYSLVADWSSSEIITDFANTALNSVSLVDGALSSINGDVFLFDLSNLAAITGYVALGTTVTSGVSTLVAGDWAIGAADRAHAQFVLVGSDTLAFDPDGTGALAAITVVGHYTYTGLTGTMIALTA